MVIARILFVYVILFSIIYGFYAGLFSDTYINKSKIPTYPYTNYFTCFALVNYFDRSNKVCWI